MREEHPSFPQPIDKSIKIWRYIDLAKFLSFLQSKAIFVSRADKLGDPFEGSTPLANRLRNQTFREIIKDPSNKKKFPDLAPFFEFSPDRFEIVMQQISTNTQNSLQTLFVSCWHMNETESAAMWHQYGASSSLCIQTTYELLAECLPENVFIGCVKYINYKDEIIPQDNGFNNIMHKRRSFEHEER